MSNKNQYVIFHKDGWALKGAGSTRATVIHPAQKSAITRAREVARNHGSEMLIHGANGRIRERNTCDKDPYPFGRLSES